MPRFHLNLYNGLGLTADEEGLELSDAAAARQEAIRSIRSVVSEEVKEGHVDLNGRIEIVGEDGQWVATIRFAEAVELQPVTAP
jgi:translation initiation factor 2 alpha subunit (eIF-2alpha)